MFAAAADPVRHIGTVRHTGAPTPWYPQQSKAEESGAEASDHGCYSSSLDRSPKQPQDKPPNADPNKRAEAENWREDNERTYFA
jgi:hypothetical protein